jgi:hypothetical protein
MTIFLVGKGKIFCEYVDLHAKVVEITSIITD